MKRLIGTSNKKVLWLVPLFTSERVYECWLGVNVWCLVRIVVIWSVVINAVILVE